MDNWFKANVDFFHRSAGVIAHCADPGAWEVMRRVARCFTVRGVCVRWLLDGWAAKHADASSRERCVSLAHAIKLTPNGRPLLLYGARRDFDLSRNLVHEAHVAGCDSLFIFDSWKNHRINFVDPETGYVALPDRIAVIDQWQRDRILEDLADVLPEGYGECIGVLGQPALEEQARAVTAVSAIEREALKHLYCALGERMALFILEPVRQDFIRINNMDPGYDEYSMLTLFLDRVLRPGEKVVLRPHPRQDMAELQKFLATRPDAGKIALATEGMIEPLLAAADTVYGMTSMALVIAVQAGKDVVSLQAGRNEIGEALTNPLLEQCLWQEGVL